MKLPVCEIQIPYSLKEFEERAPGLIHWARPRQIGDIHSTSVEAHRLAHYGNGDKVLGAIFAGIEAQMCMRVVEQGGMDGLGGRATVICGRAGEPLSGSSPADPLPLKPVLWHRTTTEPVLIIKAEANLIKNGSSGAVQASGGRVLLFKREIPREYWHFSLSGSNLNEKLRDILLTTDEVLVEAYNEDVLADAIAAARQKATCPNCTHVHYGWVSLAARTIQELGQEPGWQPPSNQTPSEILERNQGREFLSSKRLFD